MGVLKPSEGNIIVMDDESYFTFDCPEVQANKGYYITDKENVDPEVRYRRKEKFPEKVMVWVAISRAGVSQSFMAYKSAMNSEMYRKKCLPLLKKLIDEHHSHEDVIFWPDLVTAHYAKSVLEELSIFNIQVVARDENPPAAPPPSFAR